MRKLRTVYVLSYALLLGDGLSHAALATEKPGATGPTRGSSPSGMSGGSGAGCCGK